MGVTLRPGLLLLAAAAAPWLAACQARSPDEMRRPTVSLRMGGTPPDAAVIIDEETVGQLDFVAAHGVALPLGVHHVTVKAPGYFPSDTAVDAQLGSAPVALQIALIPIPD